MRTFKLHILFLLVLAATTATIYGSVMLVVDEEKRSWGNQLMITPGEYGFGMNTVAGSGRHLDPPATTIFHVNDINDYNDAEFAATPEDYYGTLRYAIEEVNSPKTIVFDVSGYIATKSPIFIGYNDPNLSEQKGSYITIAGQTAPSPGICIKNYGLTIERWAHDILIQHVRIRPGDQSFTDLNCPDCLKESIGDCVTALWSYYPESDPPVLPPRKIVMDHCSFTWGGDMNLQLGAVEMSIINCITGEALHSPLHPKGPHSKGMLLSGYVNTPVPDRNILVAKNLFISNVDRNPRIVARNAVVVNNVFIDIWSGINSDDTEWPDIPQNTSIAANYAIESDAMDPALGNGQFHAVSLMSQGNQLYIGGDSFYYGELQTEPYYHPNEYWVNIDYPEGLLDSPSLWPYYFQKKTAADAYTYVLENVGAFPRDSVDSRLVTTATNITPGEPNGIIASEDEVGGYPAFAENVSVWEEPANPNDLHVSGYTNLEVALHEAAAAIEP